MHKQWGAALLKWKWGRRVPGGGGGAEEEGDWAVQSPTLGLATIVSKDKEEGKPRRCDSLAWLSTLRLAKKGVE